MSSKEQNRYLVTSAPGLADLLVQELRSFGLSPTLERSGAVALSGDWKTAAAVLVRSRIASRVFLSIRQFSAKNKSCFTTRYAASVGRPSFLRS